MDEARALVADMTLWPLVRDFLWDFAPQVHKSWLEGLDAQSSLVSSLMSSPRTKRYVLASLGIEPCFHTFRKDDGSRLLLLDAATLESIVKWLGALACAEVLRRVTDGATVRELKANLSGVYPDVFGFTAYFNGFGFQRRDTEAQIGIDEIVSTGFSILLASLADVPRSVVSRLKFKLPKILGDTASSSEDVRGNANMKAVVAKLLKLKFPEAYSLCC